MRSVPTMVAASSIVTLLEVSLLRSPACGQHFSKGNPRSGSAESDDGSTLGVALPLVVVVVGIVLEHVMSGGICWWSGVSSTTSTVVVVGGGGRGVLGCVVHWDLDGRDLMMDAVALSGAVMASMTGLAR
jgi:hypothetical protein